MNQETDLHRALRPWRDRAAGLVGRRIEDARQHAAAGNLQVAENRLRELYHGLGQAVSDARGAFYRRSFRAHEIDPEVHQIGLGPTADGETAARNAPIMGRSYDLDFRDLVEDARAALQSAGLAEQSSGPDAPYLENWAAEHQQRITARVSRELSDSQIAIFEAVGQILIKPEFR